MEEESTTLQNGELPTVGDVESEDDESDSEYESEDNDADIEGEDNEDDEMESNTTANDSINTKKPQKKDGSGKKRKRKRKDITKRRQIRQIIDESQLDKETVNAQLEEKERLRRLELQKSLATEGHSSHVASHPLTAAPPSNSTSDTNITPVVVDFRQKSKSKQQSAVIVIDSDDDGAVGSPPNRDFEVITSGSDVDSDDLSSVSDTSDIDENNVGLHSDDQCNVPNPDGSVLVNTDHPLSEDDILLAPQIAKCVKPHQIGGIRFLYDNLIETMARFQVSSGFGCILAHSMGLGKTLQVIAFTDIFLRHTPAKKVLIVVPINTIQNWMVEFDMWLPPKPVTMEKVGLSENAAEDSGDVRYRNFDVFLLGDSNSKTTVSRAKTVGMWNQNGGVLLMGYELYRILAMSTPCMASNKCAPPKKKRSTTNGTSNSQEPELIDLEEEEKHMDFLIGIQKALCKPGPDLVICDEGHRIKNNQANISQALKRIKTRRRVVLTGYPLQNNLIEYWCMIDFVRPNFLGNRQEFANMFERPILNGQCSDSTHSDVRLMRYRAHVLHSLLEGFVQRRSQSVLTKCLPDKEEHIIHIKMSAIQSKLYQAYIDFLLETVGHLNPIKGFHTSTKIWNHPDAFYSLLDTKKTGQRNESPLTLENEMDETNSSSCNIPQEPNTAAAQPAEEPVNSLSATVAWAKDIMKDYKPCVAENGGKVVILMEIIKESLKVGEKVLLFSQSLSTLGIIEDFLSRQDIPYFLGKPTNDGSTKWARNKSYFRLDGSTPAQERDRLIKAFNSPDNSEVLLFMLSTRAGCLGVNLIGASRVVVFDVSWNPCHDVQAVCRVYRYGQKKATHIYRLVSTQTMEKKIYDRQVSKQGVANRVVDELNPEANFTKQEIMTLICDKETDTPAEDLTSAASSFSDPVLNSICKNYSHWLAKVPFKHESLLVDRKELKLTKLEKKEAKRGYEQEKNMAQQGSRYYVNPVPEASRMSSRPVINTIPQAPPLSTQPVQPRGFSPYILQSVLGQSNNVRFASLNPNMTHNPMALSQLMPNVSATLAANILANQFQINRALNAAANGVPNSSAYGLPSIMYDGRPVSMMNRTTQPTQQTNDVVTIDLDDLPSPPPTTNSQPTDNQSDVDVTTVTNATEPDQVPSPLPTMVTNGDTSMNTMATTDATDTLRYHDVVVPGGVTMETDNLDSEANAVAMEPDSSTATRPTIPLAVLQNLLNEQGGLSTRPLPPEESPHSPTGASQI